MSETKMPERIKESGVEKDFLARLRSLGWEIYGLDEEGELIDGGAVLDGEYERETGEVVYWNLLRRKLMELNQFIDEDNVDDVISSLRRDVRGENLVEQNREFYDVIRNGKKVSVATDTGTEYRYAALIDFNDLPRNTFTAVNQFRVRRGASVRPDVALLVNGIPIVIGELKSLAQDADWHDAYNDLKNYEKQIPEMFIPVLLNIASDSRDFRYGAVGIEKDYYNPWRHDVEDWDEETEVPEAIEALLKPQLLLDLLQHFVFYEKATGGDKKIVPRYMQYYASKKLMKRIKSGQKNKGLYWHTQGSGKSYTMLYTAINLLKREGEQRIIDNPQIILIVDQDKLRKQMSDDMKAVGIKQHHVAKNIRDLQKHIKQGKSEIILTTIHMFQDVKQESQGNPNTVLMIDEAHRFMEKSLGSKLKAALPDAYHFAFTGTPVRERERDTFNEYCPPDELYHHRYSIRQGLKDGVILPVHFDLRHIVDWEMDEAAMDEEFEGFTGDMTLEEKDQIIKKYFTATDLAQLRPRIKKVVEDIVNHYASREVNGWKGMVVTPSRKAAALYGEELMKYRDPEDVAVLISGDTGSDPDDPFEPFMSKFHTTPEQRDDIVKNFKKKEQPKLLVVCDMLLTGFDAPILKTMYLDRYLTNHNLLQAIARTNRPAAGKVNGEIVDYAGAFRELNRALDYPEEVRENAAFDREKLVNDFMVLLDKTMGIFEEIEKTDSPETLNRCLSLLSKQGGARKEFESKFRRLQDIYESLSPDRRLAEEDVLARYGWLNQIWVAYQRSFNRTERPDEEIKAKTREILEKNVSVEKIRKEFPVYKVGEEHLEMLRDLGDSARANEIAHALTEQFEEDRRRNPRFEKLSERFDELLMKWKSGQMPDDVFAEKGEEVEREFIEVKQAPEQKQLTPGEYAVEELLKEEYSSHLDGENSAKKIATTIGQKFREEIDTSYKGWQKNPLIEKDICQVIIQAIVKDLKQPGLYHAKGFVKQVCEYLIENEVKINE